MSRAVSITVPHFSDDDSDLSSDDSRPAAARYDDSLDDNDDDELTSSESSESSDLEVPQPRVRVDFDDSGSDEEEEADSPHLHASHLGDALAEAGRDVPGQEEAGLANEEDGEAEQEDQDDDELAVHDPLDEGVLRSFFRDEESKLWQPQQLGFDPTSTVFLSSMAHLHSHKLKRPHAPEAFRGSWTHTDEFVGLLQQGAAAKQPRTEQQWQQPEAATTTTAAAAISAGGGAAAAAAAAARNAASTGTGTAMFVFSAQKLLAAAPRNYLAGDSLKKLLDLLDFNEAADFGRAAPGRLRLQALRELAEAVRKNSNNNNNPNNNTNKHKNKAGGSTSSSGGRDASSFASCFSLLFTFLTAWNEAEDECETVQAVATTKLGCIDLNMHRLQRIELHVREWLRDELATDGITASSVQASSAFLTTSGSSGRRKWRSHRR